MDTNYNNGLNIKNPDVHILQKLNNLIDFKVKKYIFILVY